LIIGTLLFNDANQTVKSLQEESAFHCIRSSGRPPADSIEISSEQSVLWEKTAKQILQARAYHIFALACASGWF
jgi:hypothetical protein